MQDNVENNVIKKLRSMVIEDRPIIDLVEYIIEHFDAKREPDFKIVLYFTKAFLIDIKDAKFLCSWDYFKDGTRSTEEIEKVIKPLVNERRWAKVK